MDFPKKQSQCLIPRYLLDYLTTLQITHIDPTAPWGGGGGSGSYTAGDGIDITNDVISIDNTVALKTDIPSLTGYATETWVTNQGYLVQSDLSDYVTSTDLSAELLNYAELSDLATVATTGDYDDLLNTPDLSIYELAADAFSGDYNDLTNKPIIPTVPTNVSAFTNDAGYITASDLTGYATETWVTNQGYLTSVSWNDISSKPTFATVATSGSYNDLTDKPIIPTVPTNVSAFTNDAGYITASDLTGYATETWVTNQGYLSSADLTNYVTTDTAQDISGQKTFKDNIILDKDQLVYPNGIYLSRINNNYEKGIYAFKNRNYGIQNSECCGSLLFEYISNITRSGKTGTFEYYNVLSNGEMSEGQYATPSAVGFKIYRGINYSTKYFLAPRPSFSDDWNSAYSQYDAYYIPMVISDGTTNYYANEQGIITIPASGGGTTYTAGTGIDITNDTISVDSSVVTTSDLATVATTGSYNDLSNKPTIPSSASSTSTSTFTPTTETLTFTYSDNTTATITIVTAATVSTTTTTTLS